ncbi:FRG domain-containing protein [Acinetobacter sp. 3657]|uniref:FRG domain-containing protein n=1 Tax=Acinetobacter sp. 3657 TaxID=2817764 RepID=UPI0028601986|nr:hypothetical protein [Prolinoborus sp. 3657]
MEYIKSDLFGRIVSPKTLPEILDLVSRHANTRRNVYLWRGQGDIEWPIHSSAYRRLLLDSKKVEEKDILYYEKYLLENATHQGYRFESGQELSDLELLAKLQHHGAATRLIDCSRNMLVALWFCCFSEPQKTGLLFGIHSDHLGGSENRGDKRKYDDIFKNLKQHNHPQTWHPPAVSKRIVAQGAQFLYSFTTQSFAGSLALEQDKEIYIAISIQPQVKERFLKELSNIFDIRYFTLFPDIDGFGYAHSFRYKKYDIERW